MKCGVLALQGGFEAHRAILSGLGAATMLVRTAAELEQVGCLVIPGGESSAMLLLMEPEGLARSIVGRVRRGMAVLATCAGVILLANRVTPTQSSLAVLDVDVLRNAYGRQVDSKLQPVTLAPVLGDPGEVEGVFIRAPKISQVGSGVEVLGRVGSDPVLVRQGRVIASTYHPELAGDTRVHRLFVDLAEEDHD